MNEPILYLALGLLAALLVAILFLLVRLAGRLDTRVAAGVREAVGGDLRAGREEASRAALATRQEISRSLELVNERLEAVHQGLGEVRSLAGGVDDLRRVLTNVKARGTWAEVQLGMILDEFLAPVQYATNVATRAGSNERVEFAVRLPGRSDDRPVWLPIDSKFPREDYIRLQEASDAGDADAAGRAADALARTLRDEAKKIREKYVDPPNTTDFAVLYLATEGLYAEVTRQPELMAEIQERHRVMVAGPTTLAALLSSLQMGFRTLAIEQRAGEAWEVLAAVKTEFGKFGRVLERLKKQLDAASNTVARAEVRTRAMTRRLESVERLPDGEAPDVLRLALDDEADAAGSSDRRPPDAGQDAG
ncbi:MAG: DNA recombination protein RmuC [Candidatus Longimicrobiales bacterium M2_2A_002]